jgi:hypothetical protein
MLDWTVYYMPCFTPLPSFKGNLNANGKMPLVVLPRTKVNLMKYSLRTPCGGCRFCRVRKSIEWGLRCEHEMQMHDHSCFITLTYANEFMPRVGSTDVGNLVKDDFKRFIKRFRERISEPTSPFFHPEFSKLLPLDERKRLRYYYGGEYGEKNTVRPHFHAIIFGYDFNDKYWPMKRPRGQVIYRSKFLEELWPNGHSSVGTATFHSACYVARYCMKKVTGKLAHEHYQVIDSVTGEVFQRTPEFNDMSRDRGIGKDWFDKFAASDVYVQDEIITRAGRRYKPPRYYDSKYEELYPEHMECIKDARREAAKSQAHNCTEKRLAVRSKCFDAKLGLLKRDLE